VVKLKFLVFAIIVGLVSIPPNFAWAEGSLFSGFELFPTKLDGVTMGAFPLRQSTPNIEPKNPLSDLGSLESRGRRSDFAHRWTCGGECGGGGCAVTSP
jgi:hypothetical protein